MKFKHLIILFFSLIFFCSDIISQNYPYDIDYYSFVNYDSNYLQFYGDSATFEKLFYKIDTLILRGEGHIKIIQIGASHTQADIFSAQVRKRLQNFDYTYNAGRGYVFPYKMMKTNNPYDYKTSHTGLWEVCRNVDGTACTLGLTGISAKTLDSSATFKVILNNKDIALSHHFNKIKVFHISDTTCYIPNLELDTAIFDRIINFDKGYTEFILNDYYTEISFKLEKQSSFQNYFTIFGIFLETDEPGFIYHPIGINGASTKSYHNLTFFRQQLEVIDPDLIIIDLGTNDGYTSKFDSAEYAVNYNLLIEQIKSVNQDIAIITFVPNDCYLWKKRANPATAQQENVIRSISTQQNTGVWDKYQIMGGFNSSLTWYKNGLMTYDRVHFTNDGYQFLGNLFFNAFLHSYDNHIEKIKVPLRDLQ
jgi:hypothetical protein